MQKEDKIWLEMSFHYVVIYYKTYLNLTYIFLKSCLKHF